MKSIGIAAKKLEREDGFTVAELLVVSVVIGVLLMIGIPAFLGAQNGSNEAAAKSDAAQAVKTQKMILLTEGAAAADAHKLAKLKQAEPALDFRISDPGDTKVRGAVYIRQATGDTLVLAAANGTDDCFWTRISATGATEYARGTCDDAATASFTWSSGW